MRKRTILPVLILILVLPWLRGQETVTPGSIKREKLPVRPLYREELPGGEVSPAGDTIFRSGYFDLDTTIFTMEGEIQLQTGQNLDSLLNLWYVNQALEDAVDDYSIEADTLIPDYSDSVYMARLALIPSVIDLTYNRIVRNYINVYTHKRREQVRIMLGLSDFYFPMFEEIFDFYGVPYELKYLAIIESALNPRAVSRAGAVGTWQFMYPTGRHYGLTINSLIDERRDPLAATHAAARYMVDLYRLYGDWTLALAAYNCGPGNVNKAIRRSGGKKNFWDIYYFLPRETRGYVPAFIAATYTMNFYQDHLLSRAPLALPRHTDTIMVHDQVHLQQIAEVLGIPMAQLRDLNPQYRVDVVPASAGKALAVQIPVEYVAGFIDLQDSIFAYKDSVFFDQGKLVATPMRSTSDYKVDLPPDKYDKLIYTVQSGDNIGYIADWYDVRASDIQYWNNIRRNLIRVGQKLVIYKTKGTADRYRQLDGMSFAEKQRFAGRAVSSASPGSGSAGSGGSSGTSGASTAAASSATGASSGTGASGASVSPGSGGETYVNYTVKSGDTLWEISRKFPGSSASEIARLNNLTNSSKIQPGQVIRIRQVQ
jgi:membrane-bound lytic murein transglycosylase D